MLNHEWKLFLQICRTTLGIGAWDSYLSESWCAYTTFSSLTNRSQYWCCGFPDLRDLKEEGLADGGLWRQSIRYDDLAHIIIPATFSWERMINGKYSLGSKEQNLVNLGQELTKNKITHRKTDRLLEIKFF